VNENSSINFKYKIETDLPVVAAFSPSQEIKVIFPKMGPHNGHECYTPQLIFGDTFHKSRMYSETMHSKM
jgi:hypothetical protein